MIEPGWYLPTTGARYVYPRWVLGEINGVVRYSKGGAEHFMCLERTFRKWMVRAAARRAETDKAEVW